MELTYIGSITTTIFFCHLDNDNIGTYTDHPGIGYSVVRVPMASCDFSTRLYTYADTPGDYNLDNFTLAHEDISMKVCLSHTHTHVHQCILLSHLLHPLRSLFCSELRPCLLVPCPCWPVLGAPLPGWKPMVHSQERAPWMGSLVAKCIKHGRSTTSGDLMWCHMLIMCRHKGIYSDGCFNLSS